MTESTVEPAVRVLIVDDHPLLREGTRSFLGEANGIEVVGVTGEGMAAIELAGQVQPDVVLLDIHLPDISGVEVARRIRVAFPEIAILVLTAFDDPSYRRAMAQLGTRGYLLKTASTVEVVQAIQHVAAGNRLPGSSTGPDSVEDASPLTARELGIMQLLAAGRRNAEIAELMHVSVKTIEYHVSNLLDKLGARSRTEAIIRARARGLLLNEPVSGSGSE